MLSKFCSILSILPYLKGRPQSLLRTPNGIKAKGFFHKDAGEGTPSYVKTKKLFSESTNKHINKVVNKLYDFKRSLTLKLIIQTYFYVKNQIFINLKLKRRKVIKFVINIYLKRH